MVACASVRFEVARVSSQADDHPEWTALGQAYAPHAASAPGRSGFRLLVSGPEAFAARGALAEAALKTLDLQYYIVAHDSTATLLLEGALRAAQRGVRVRLLVDDLNVGDRDSDLALLAAHANVEVRLFNPLAQRGGLGIGQVLELLGNSDRLNRRMHNKLWIADNAVAVMGGRNLGDAYFNAAPDSDFADLDLLAAGPVVREMSRSFDLYWNSELSVPIEAITGPPPAPAELQRASAAMTERAQRFRAGEYVHALRATLFGGLIREGRVILVVAPARILVDIPARPEAVAATATTTTSAIFPELRQVVEQAQRDVLLVSPYLVPGARSVEVLCGVARRGVRVRILTNSLVSTDVPVVHAGYARYRPQMLACGVELYELRPNGVRAKPARIGLSSGASLHTKAIAVDGKVVFIGSMNLDPRSKHLNSEVALRIDSVDLGSHLAALFDEATTPDQAFRVSLDEPGNTKSPLHWDGVEDDRPVRYASEPLASLWRRWVTRLLGVLAPEELL
jgi:putative cardiolipin synthase